MKGTRRTDEAPTRFLTRRRFTQKVEEVGLFIGCGPGALSCPLGAGDVKFDTVYGVNEDAKDGSEQIKFFFQSVVCGWGKTNVDADSSKCGEFDADKNLVCASHLLFPGFPKVPGREGGSYERVSFPLA